MTSRRITFRVNGEDVTCDMNEDLRIHNPDAERHEVASHVAWWGTVAAAQQGRVDKLTADAASWLNATIAASIEEDEKISEWKAKAKAQGHPTYHKLQHAVAEAQEAASSANTIHWAYVRKMDMLKAMLVGEAADKRASGEVGRVPDQQAPVADPNDPRWNAYKSRRKPSGQEK